MGSCHMPNALTLLLILESPAASLTLSRVRSTLNLQLDVGLCSLPRFHPVKMHDAPWLVAAFFCILMQQQHLIGCAVELCHCQQSVLPDPVNCPLRRSSGHSSLFMYLSIYMTLLFVPAGGPNGIFVIYCYVHIHPTLLIVP